MSETIRSFEPPLPNPLGFFFTWNTYGTWLPGDARGWVKYHQGFQLPDPILELESAAVMTEDACVLDFHRRRIVNKTIELHCMRRSWKLHAVNCRLTATPKGMLVRARDPSQKQLCTLRNCELFTALAPCMGCAFADGRFVIDNCLLAGGGAISTAHLPRQRDLTFRVSRSTLVGGTVLTFNVGDPENVLEAKTDFAVGFDLSENVIAGQDSMWLAGKNQQMLTMEETVALPG